MSNYPPTEKYSEAGFAPPLTPGNYKVKLSEIKYKDRDGHTLIDKNGHEYVKFVFDVSDQPNRLFEQFCFDEDNQYAAINLGKFKQFQVACGIDTASGGSLVSLIDNVCMATIKNREHQGQTYNNIVEFSALDGTEASVPHEEPPDVKF